jgi:hypothetical protein
MKRSIVYLLIPVLFSMFSSCEKESADVLSLSEKETADAIIGTWVSEMTGDTLYFISNHLFNKSLNDIKHTFEYSISSDSIIIQYKGPNKIWVLPTTHYFSLVSKQLTIDFSNGCYGFNSEVETFLKQ